MFTEYLAGIPDICNSNMRGESRARIRCFIMRQHITPLLLFSFLLFFFFFFFLSFFSPVYFSPTADTFICSILRVCWSLREKRLRVGRRAVATKKEDFWYFSREQGNRAAGKRTDYIDGRGGRRGGRLNKEQK